MKFGKLAPREDPRTLKLAHYLLPDLPPPPDRYNALPRAEEGAKQPDPTRLFPMLGNDRYGDCVAEGTQVVAPTVLRGYRAPYSGPVVTIRTQFGRELTVTPNHGVLTPRGFVAARLLKQGDYVIGGDFAQGFRAGTLGVDFDQPPALIEQVFSALNRVGTSAQMRGDPMRVPAYFHGDGRFVNGDVDVVDTDRLLKSESDPALREPHGHEQVGSAGELESVFAGDCAPFQRVRFGGLPALRGVCGLGDRHAFGSGHLGVAEGYRLQEGSWFNTGLSEFPLEVAPINTELFAEGLHAFSGPVSRERRRKIDGAISFVASLLVEDRPGFSGRSDGFAGLYHPAEKSTPTDSHLPAQLFRRFPGLVAAEKIIEVRDHDYLGHVYDLSTEQRWYSSNGIITHNCTIAAAAHAETLWESYLGKRRVPTRKAVLDDYFALTGGDDTGLVMLDVCNRWRKVGITGEKILAFAGVDRRKHDLIRQSVWLFGGVYLGFVVQQAAISDFQARRMWTPGPRTDSGHCVWVYAYTPDWLAVLTWGSTIRADWHWFDQMADESFAILPGESTLPGFAPGVDYEALKADLAIVAT